MGNIFRKREGEKKERTKDLLRPRNTSEEQQKSGKKERS